MALKPNDYGPTHGWDFLTRAVLGLWRPVITICSFALLIMSANTASDASDALDTYKLKAPFYNRRLERIALSIAIWVYTSFPVLFSWLLSLNFID